MTTKCKCRNSIAIHFNLTKANNIIVSYLRNDGIYEEANEEETHCKLSHCEELKTAVILLTMKL